MEEALPNHQKILEMPDPDVRRTDVDVDDTHATESSDGDTISVLSEAESCKNSVVTPDGPPKKRLKGPAPPTLVFQSPETVPSPPHQQQPQPVCSPSKRLASPVSEPIPPDYEEPTTTSPIYDNVVQKPSTPPPSVTVTVTSPVVQVCQDAKPPATLQQTEQLSINFDGCESSTDDSLPYETQANPPVERFVSVVNVTEDKAETDEESQMIGQKLDESEVLILNTSSVVSNGVPLEIESKNDDNNETHQPVKPDEDKPQFFFKDKINNNSKLFLHKLKKKPHCLNPLSMEQRARHPYEFELNKFTPHPKFWTVQREVPRFKPVSSTPLIMVDTTEAFEHLLQDLLSQTVIGVDLEHHSDRSYRGITCLMQISTDKTDYIIDTLKLWDHLQPLNKVFCDPNIVKIFQGADSDVIWLQRDFGIYVVNLFDTFQAASLLGFQKKGLSFLLQHYCQVHVDKKYQLEDWRIRPLPQEMVNYAREDTHYLIYIYERMKRDLYSRHCLGDVKGTPEESKDSNPKSESSLIPPVDEEGVNQVVQVWNNSRSVCLRQFRIPTLEEMYSKFHSSLSKQGKKFNNQESYALQEIFSWRDRVARELDESPFFVMSKFVMLNIINELHNEPEKILEPISLHRSVHQHLPQLQEVIVRAKAIAIQSSPMLTKKQTKKSGAASSSAHELSKIKNNFHGESPLADDVSRSENKASKWRDSDIPALIRILHGNIRSKHAIAEEFLFHLEQNRAGENKNGPLKEQILAKIAEISSWSKCTEAGAMNGRKCRLVQSDVLERYNLAELSVINTWEFATEKKKRGRKADDSRTEEDTPPAKTPRVSLIKQFVQPAASSSASKVSSSQENELPEGEN